MDWSIRIFVGHRASFCPGWTATSPLSRSISRCQQLARLALPFISLHFPHLLHSHPCYRFCVTWTAIDIAPWVGLRLMPTTAASATPATWTRTRTFRSKVVTCHWYTSRSQDGSGVLTFEMLWSGWLTRSRFLARFGHDSGCALRHRAQRLYSWSCGDRH